MKNNKITAWAVMYDKGEIAKTGVRWAEKFGWSYAIFETEEKALRFANKEDIKKVEIKILN